MRRADPTKAFLQVLRDLKHINSTCDLSKELSNALHRFRVALLDEDVVINRTICLDLMYLDRAVVLYIVDKDNQILFSFIPR